MRTAGSPCRRCRRRWLSSGGTSRGLPPAKGATSCWTLWLLSMMPRLSSGGCGACGAVRRLAVLVAFAATPCSALTCLRHVVAPSQRVPSFQKQQLNQCSWQTGTLRPLTRPHSPPASRGRLPARVGGARGPCAAAACVDLWARGAATAAAAAQCPSQPPRWHGTMLSRVWGR
jgi:hypothetical protein